MTPRLQRGHRVHVRHSDDGGDWCPAIVALASDTNPSSVALILMGAVRGGSGIIAGTLPLTVDYDAETVVGLTGDSYEIDVEWEP